MASDQGSIATQAPLLTSVAPEGAAAAPAIAPPPAAYAAEPTRSKSLKRSRDLTPTGATTAPKLARLAEYTAQHAPPILPLTGAAALQDERVQREEERRLHPPGAMSENPSQKVLSDLLSGDPKPMSRPEDAPPSSTSAISETDGAVYALSAAAVAGAADNMSAEDRPPVSAGPALSGLNGSPAAEAPVTQSPAPLEAEARKGLPVAAQPDAQMMEDKVATSLSYPGILAPRGGSMAAPAAPPRSGSLPMAPSAQEAGMRSPSLRKHKCPYCETEFTRQHNLKSHLLTHSQEKPFVCQDCQMRFRRLHDLKRHNKLHTGEKPHICPKCERKFARGDALARHAKGAEGCAGRRASQGSFGGGDDYEGAEGEDSAMSGVVYDGDQTLTEEERRRRLSLPGMKGQHTAGPVAGESFGPHSSTYPPAGSRAATTSGLFPPNVDRGSGSSSLAAPSGAGTGHTATGSVSSVPSAGSSSLYSQTAMTESPKPLSPGVAGNSLAQEAVAQARKRTSTANSKLGPSGLSLPDHGAAAAGRSSHKQGGPESSNNFFTSEGGLWAYAQTLGEQVAQLTDKIKGLEGHIGTLERTKAAQEVQITDLTVQVTRLRQEVLDARAQVPPLAAPPLAQP